MLKNIPLVGENCMNEQDTFDKLRRPGIVELRQLVHNEAHRMRNSGIVFGCGWWDDTTLEKFLATKYWTLDEYRDKVIPDE